LAALPGLIAEQIAETLPALRSCDGMVGGFDLDELKRQGVSAPAVRVSLLRVRPKATESGPHRRWNAEMAAFVVTKDTLGLKRDIAAMGIVQTLLRMIPDSNWAEPGVGPAEGVEARVIVDRGARDLAVHLSAVTWSQPLTLAALPEGTPLPIDLYVGGEPL
jgi:hypothetical protein